jgi:hypothetical protein
MGNRLEGGLVKEQDTWRIEGVKLYPFFQSGNIEVMGLNHTKKE